MFEKPLGLRENPFLAGHHPKYLFPSREHQEALAHLRYGIQNREPFVLITGEVGTGKTTAVYDALAEWGSRAVVALITNSALTRTELLEEICLRFGVATAAPMSKPQALVELQKQLSAVRARGELAILLVDEAQNLDRELLEEIRLLSNLEVNGEYLLQIFLVGQPELESKLAQKELRQLRQRIGIHYRILPLSVTETARYIHHRVAVAGGNAEELFTSEACVEIYRITNGIPREINIVAGQALLNAFVEDSDAVTPEHARAVEREIEFQSVLRRDPEGGETGPAAPTPAVRRSTTPTEAVPKTAPPKAAPPKQAPPKQEPQKQAPPKQAPPKQAPPKQAPPKQALPKQVPPKQAPPKQAPRKQGPPTPVVPMPAIVRPTGSPPADEMELEDEETAPPTEYSPDEGLEDTDLVPPEPQREEVAVPDHPRRRSTDVPAVAHPATPDPESDPHRPPAILPPWFDEIIVRRQTTTERSGTAPQEISAVAFSAPLPALTAREPGRAPYPYQEPGAPPAEHLPPERIAPHPGDPSPVSARLDLISARLRARLDENGEPIPGRGAAFGRLVASLLIAAVAIGVLLLVRFGPWTAQPKTPSGQNGTTPTVAPGNRGLDGLAPAESTEAGGSASQSTTRTVRVGSRRSAENPLRATGEPGAAPVGPRTAGTFDGPRRDMRPIREVPPSFDIAVGTYLNEERALAERTRLTESTTFPSRVVMAVEDTSSVYRVVVGPFGDRIAAERAASDLIQRGLVTEARVVAVVQEVAHQP